MKEKMASKKKKARSSGQSSSSVISDPRFANIQSDPRYRLPSKKHTHVKLDKRFSHMLRDSDFSKNAPVDRYGRKLARDDTRKQLEKFYRFDDEEDEEDKNEEDGDSEEYLSIDDDEEVQKELRRVERTGYDPARDGGFESSSSDESSSDEEEEEDDVDDAGMEIPAPGQQDADIPTGEYTERIAIVNLDWDNIKAQDLMAVFTSFLPAGGAIRKVSVYPSEFGRERMEMEEMDGPPKEIFSQNTKAQDEDSLSEEEDEEEEEEKIKKSLLVEGNGDDFDAGKLRQYQLERLRYFYAILTCSSKEVAKHIYDAVDGTEYMSSANFFDLRFVPDSTDFTEDVPRDECVKLPDDYQPSDFVTDALQHSKVKLTWDADDRARKDAQERAFKGNRKEIDENDLKAYLGSDSSDDEEEGAEAAGVGDAPKLSKKEAERAKVRALLGLSDKPAAGNKEAKPVGEMEVTFSAGLTAAPAKDTVFENEPEKEETTREKYVRKERERKQRRKDKLKAKRSGEEALDEQGDGKDRQETKEAEEDLGFDDPFFTAPELDAAKAAKQRKEEKKKQQEQRRAEEEASASKRAELELLMMDDDKATPIAHFDMNEIEKAEKRARKSGKHKKGKKSAAETAPVDNFEMNVKDPRFQSLFESHEYAIDPTNPRFKQTKGMNTLLEEGRKRRRNVDDTGSNEEKSGDKPKKSKKSKSSSANTDDGEAINKLVQKVKAKTKK
ncbi:hypothetical protein MGYG_03168 [Nannizzia gypsea CBS 118893]|uniref:Uncharacterized protein n=1 Tax=Arthroderma gypseum (strain ATCC MYA-4604 / CBS 118893) TaxID=535722 RepID=E4URA0_ARTGP|nr:hypothetical protein MGYG_03168 [Nannizzia gypsea CBS 118893]EFR00163.1 hypothetical protein MGYG_03168 [Nannizzia gypsea CBS 118893]